ERIAVRVDIPDRDEALGARIRKRREQDRMHRADDRRARADPEGERHDDDEREARSPRERAYRLDEVLPDRSHETRLRPFRNEETNGKAYARRTRHESR